MNRYSIFDGVQDSVIILDRDANVHFANTAACLLLGVSERRLSSGRPLAQFISFNQDLIINDGGFDAITEKTGMRELEFSTPNGASGATQISIVPDVAPPGEPKRWILNMRDVNLERLLHTKYRAELDGKEAVIKELEIAKAELQSYSSQLEKMVAERTRELSETNGVLKAILDSLGQGILVFDRSGRCLPVYSQVCLKIFEVDPNGKAIEDVMHLEGKAREDFVLWRETAFEELLDFIDMVPLAPAKVKHSQDLEIAVAYHRMADPEGRMNGVMIVATDRTTEMRALKKAEEERELVAKIVQVARNRDAFRDFVGGSKKFLKSCIDGHLAPIDEILRHVHTVKGAAASFSLPSVARACHQMEDALKTAARDQSEVQRELKGNAEIISQTLNHELDVLSELLGPIGVDDENQIVEVTLGTIQDWAQQLLATSDPTVIREVALQVLKAGTEKSVITSVRHFSSSVVELAEALGKKVVPLEIAGGELKIPPRFGQALLASLVHAVRNAIYHGIESPNDRHLAGKPESGRISLAFEQVQASDGDGKSNQYWLRIKVMDDGRGIDPAKIRMKLAEQKIDAGGMSDEDVIQEIFRDNLSTAQAVDQISGRGLGMGAIAAEARRLGGRCRVYSKPGEGMCLVVEVPLPRVAFESGLGALSKAG